MCEDSKTPMRNETAMTYLALPTSTPAQQMNGFVIRQVGGHFPNA